jgi:Na+/proline symporter
MEAVVALWACVFLFYFFFGFFSAGFFVARLHQEKEPDRRALFLLVLLFWPAALIVFGLFALGRFAASEGKKLAKKW